MNKNHKRISAVVLALALGFSTAGAGIFAPVAGAQIGANQISSINMGAGVTLNIEKNVGLPVADGDTSGLEKLEGAQFLIQKIEGIDLQTLEGWEDVAALDPANITNTLITIDTLTTDASGLASISTTPENNFTVGAYLVTETPPTGYTGADPFIVTLPFTENGVWSYEQTVKPKNQKDELAVKEVLDEGATLGSQIEYTITSPVPAGDITSLVFTDVLPGELTMDTDQVNAVTVAGLVAGDFTPAFDDATNTLTVSLTETGIAKAQNAGSAAVTFQATITSLPTDDVIANEATVSINDGAITYETNPGDDPEGYTETRLADLTINKLDSSNALIEDEDLSATFQLWRCEAEGTGHKVIGEPLSAALVATDPTSVTDTFNTVNGQAVLYGAQVLDWVNGAQVTDSTLCVVETQAPEGYSLNPAPQPVQFTEATDDNWAMVVDVVNLTEEEAGGGQLPSTGGQGTMALIAAGVLVAAAGGAASVRANRARR